jgi:hypothetical protein
LDDRGDIARIDGVAKVISVVKTGHLDKLVRSPLAGIDSLHLLIVRTY